MDIDSAVTVSSPVSDGLSVIDTFSDAVRPDTVIVEESDMVNVKSRVSLSVNVGSRDGELEAVKSLLSDCVGRVLVFVRVPAAFAWGV
jgi:hypothetical protein